MNDLVKIVNGKPVVSSKDIADKFGKTHRKVMRDIKEMSCSNEFRAANFGPSSYTSPQNKVFPCMTMTKNGFAFLCMGFTGKKAANWKEQYIDAFDKMESYIKKDMRDTTLMDSINKVSAQLDDLASAGSAWGKTGHEIRLRKSEATKELIVLMDKAQMKLGFEL